MRIFLNETEVLDLAMELLDMMRPNPDRIHDIAEKMDMEYNEELGLWEDIEERSILVIKRRIALNQ